MQSNTYSQTWQLEFILHYFNYGLSTSNGNTIRLNPVNPFTDTMAMRTSSANVLFSWTDDGLPFNSTVEEFSKVFECPLGETMLLLLVNIEPIVLYEHRSAIAQATEKSVVTPVQSRDNKYFFEYARTN